MEIGAPAAQFPPFPTLARLALALAVGLFVGLERERRGKEAGLRTFGFASLLGGMGGLLGEDYALVSLGLLGVLVVFLNWQTLRANEGAELTTSAALLVTGFDGVLCGLGHTFTPVAVAVGAAALLAWKERLAGFTLNLTDTEVRSAILLAILAFVIYPVLPQTPVDPWGLVQPREAWLTVILIAAIGFANYVLLKMYGARGLEVASFLGGLVNSTVTVTELAHRVHEASGKIADAAYRGVLLSTAAMVLRNAVLLGILATGALSRVALAFLFMLVVSLGAAYLPRGSRTEAGKDVVLVRLASPFSLQAAIKFGVLFLALEVAGHLAQSTLGQVGFYVVSLIGGTFSSASAVASAATLASHGTISDQVAGTGAVLASLASAGVNLPLMARVSGSRAVTLRLAWTLAATMLGGALGAVIQGALLGELRIGG